MKTQTKEAILRWKETSKGAEGKMTANDMCASADK